jgi:hypothetical protein
MLRVILMTLALALMPSLAFGQKKMQMPPEDGTKFLVEAQAPKWITADLEIRDMKNELWPSFLYGKPSAPGEFQWDAKKPSANLAMIYDKVAQKQGDQSRRMLGQLGNALPIKLEITSLGEITMEKRDKGKPVPVMPAKGEIILAGKTVALTGQATHKWSYAKDAERPDAVMLTVQFTHKGEELGFQKVEEAKIIVNLTAYLKPSAARK